MATASQAIEANIFKHWNNLRARVDTIVKEIALLNGQTSKVQSLPRVPEGKLVDFFSEELSR